MSCNEECIFVPGNKDTHGINSMRLAEVWMDGYKRLFYTHRRDLLVSINSVKVGRGLDGWIQTIILYT